MGFRVVGGASEWLEGLQNGWRGFIGLGSDQRGFRVVGGASEWLEGLQSGWRGFFRVVKGASEWLEGLQSGWRGFRVVGGALMGFRALVGGA
jgi:hypothetical protein